MGAVRERELRRYSGREVRQHLREVAAGLLVLPRAGEEGGHVDLVDERVRRERVQGCRVVVPVQVDLADHARGLEPQRLVRRARRVALLDAALGPVLTLGAGVGLPFLCPLEREAVVEDPARVHHAPVRVVDDRERGDRGEVRRFGRGDEQLGDARVRDADHPDLAERDPRLRGDGLDRVVAVERLERFEVLPRATRAARAAHVDAHGRVAERLREPRRGLVASRGSTGRSPSTRSRWGRGRRRSDRGAARRPTAACRHAS